MFLLHRAFNFNSNLQTNNSHVNGKNRGAAENDAVISRKIRVPFLINSSLILLIQQSLNEFNIINRATDFIQVLNDPQLINFAPLDSFDYVEQ